MLTNDGYATETFTEWCVATAALTADNWAYGFSRIEMKMRADAAHNRDSFPPRTAIIWCSWCFPPELKGAQATTTEGMAAASRVKHPSIKTDNERLLLEQPGYKERKKKAGNDSLSNIKGMFE